MHLLFWLSLVPFATAWMGRTGFAALPVAAYGAAVAIPNGNGLIAVYVAAITLGIRRPDIRSYFASQSEDLLEIVKLGIFVVFGSLLTFDGLLTWSQVREGRANLEGLRAQRDLVRLQVRADVAQALLVISLAMS